MHISRFIAEIFRYIGDFLHVASKFVLLSKIYSTRSCSGLSLKTQLLYLMVFISRYLDLFDFDSDHVFRSVYNFCMKLAFIGSSSFIIYLMYFKLRSTYDKKSDIFNIAVLIVPSLLLSHLLKSFTIGYYNYFIEFLYTFSIILECVAILPQLVQLQEAGESETMTSTFVFLLGTYRLCYTIYFIIKKFAGLSADSLPIASGIIQTILYVDFFVLYYKYVFKSGGAQIIIKQPVKREL